MDVVFRTDASLQIGTGHVMRCLTLAEGLRAAGAAVSFICREHAGHLCELIAARGYPLHRLPAPAASAPPEAGAPAHGHWLGLGWQQDAADTAAALPGRPDWLVIDHYALDARWEQALRPAAARIMVIDDLADRPHDCDLLLDQNLAPQMDGRYDGLLPPAAVRLLGPHYALLRPEFAAARAALRARDGQVRRLFLFIGGADPDNHTGRALQAVASLQRPALAVDVVIGGANPHHAALAEQCATLPGARLHRGVDNMAELMAAADLAIGAGGGAMWERACVGLPSLVIAAAENQQSGSTAMARQGRVLYLGDAENALQALPAALQTACAAPELLGHLEQGSLALVDGRGAGRVLRRLQQLSSAAGLSLRAATAADCDPIWQWRNAETVRRFSGSSAAIPLEQHREWFAATLANPSRQLLVGEIGGRAAGILRYDREGAKATISVYLTPDFLGQGIGAALIAAGSGWVRGHWPGVAQIEAVILPGNRASAQAFEAAGYAEQLNIFALRIRD
jgi:UDP-2,4-diacetamido-2,4,6-trideoxy-beta-L-altropyranose hydrolase